MSNVHNIDFTWNEMSPTLINDYLILTLPKLMIITNVFIIRQNKMVWINGFEKKISMKSRLFFVYRSRMVNK